MPGSEVNELGRVLQEARTRKGATLADAQQATKIRQSFLQALENEDYSVLPPPFYIRGFIKNYAVYLGLDPRATVQIFDEALENEALARAAGQADVVHSADSGGRTGMFPLAGLSQGEARLVEASSEKLNLAALPAPALPGDSYENADSADSGGYVSGGPLARRNYNGLYAPEKYVLKPVMLPETKGAFYMPNFIPVVLVVIIIAAACLLVYRGISSNQNVTSEAAVATATAQASVTLDSSLTLTPGATTTAGSSFTAPPFFTPDSSMAAPTPEIAGGVVSPKNGKPAQVAPAATPPPPPP
ncbi:MAG TPA: helix-turn-helix transcriptional regulator, partial [Chloroflexia bacterium]|nr:helix-turn-helix transcriptional regulator [Chloroflexia bacterium]